MANQYVTLVKVLDYIIKKGQHPEREDTLQGIASQLIDVCLTETLMKYTDRILMEKSFDGHSHQVNLNGAGVILYMDIDEQGNLKFKLIGDQVDNYKGSVQKIHEWLKKEGIFMDF